MFFFPVLQTILFTTDEDILLRVAEHDKTFQGEVAGCHGSSDEEAAERPGTGDSGGDASEGGEGGEGKERPFTVTSGIQHPQTDPTSYLVGQGKVPIPLYKLDHAPQWCWGWHCLTVSTVVQLMLTAGWGDPHSLGLAGVELLHADGHTLPLTTEQVQVSLLCELHMYTHVNNPSVLSPGVLLRPE